LWWLAVSLLAAAMHWYPVALVLSFTFFLTGLRKVHNAFHLAPGLTRRLTSTVLVIMSILMLGSMHTLRFNHLRHHRLNSDEGDVEGRAAEMSWWQPLAFGPVFPFLLHSTALGLGDRKRRAIVLLELALNAVWLALVLSTFHSGILRYHIAAMMTGQCLTAFFAVWTVHHDCDRTITSPGRCARNSRI
jgi:fatty acid desaturase